MKLFKQLTPFERGLWLSSVILMIISYVLFGNGDILNLAASLVGATSLIFLAKGYVAGQFLMIAFSLMYGVISFFFSYYGEMITYLGMTMPMAVLAAVEWIRHPYKQSAEVEVRRITRRDWLRMTAFSVLVTAVFYVILRALGNANLLVSTVSVTTSFAAAYLTYLRSSYYALFYAANDVVLIVLWVLASVADSSYVPMAACFVMFLVNDLYGFYNWRNMQRAQS